MYTPKGVWDNYGKACIEGIYIDIGVQSLASKHYIRVVVSAGYQHGKRQPDCDTPQTSAAVPI